MLWEWYVEYVFLCESVCVVTCCIVAVCYSMLQSGVVGMVGWVCARVHVSGCLSICHWILTCVCACVCVCVCVGERGGGVF